MNNVLLILSVAVSAVTANAQGYWNEDNSSGQYDEATEYCRALARDTTESGTENNSCLGIGGFCSTTESLPCCAGLACKPGGEWGIPRCLPETSGVGGR